MKISSENCHKLIFSLISVKQKFSTHLQKKLKNWKKRDFDTFCARFCATSRITKIMHSIDFQNYVSPEHFAAFFKEFRP